MVKVERLLVHLEPPSSPLLNGVCLNPPVILSTTSFPFTTEALADHNYVTPNAIPTVLIVSSSAISSSSTNMLAYRSTFATIDSDSGHVIPKLKLERIPDEKNVELIKIESKCKSKGKTKGSKKENVRCCDASNAQSVAKTKKTPKKRIKEEIKTKPITDYFPSQRCKRKTSKALMKEKSQEVEELILTGNEDGFDVHDFPGKGRGVIATKHVARGDFVLEYCGELITTEEAKRREMFYANNESIGCYMYYFSHGNKQYCVDATKETTRLGRLVNHSKKGNLKTKTFQIEETPHLILVADRDILPGEELLYDYGDRSKRSLQYYPWLAT